MKAKQRTLALLIVLALVAGLCYALVAKKNSEDAASSAAGGTVIAPFTALELDRISYTAGGAQITLEKQNDTWVLAGDETYHISQTLANSMVTAITGLSAERTISDVTDYAQYGTDVPGLTVTAGAGGISRTLSFGVTNSVSDVSYLQLDGDGAVYVISSSLANAFQYDAAGLYDTAYSPFTVQRS